MTIYSKRPIIIILLVLLGLSLAPHALALELEYPDWFLKETRQKIEAGQMDVLGVLIFDLFNVFLVIAGVAAFVILVIAGIRYLTSIGNPSVMADAKSQAFSALLGLGLLLSSYLILTTINPQLVELKEPGFKPIGPVVYAPPGKIAVAVEKPKEDQPDPFDMGTGMKKIELAGSLILSIDTDTLEAWVIADKEDTSLPGGFWRPWIATLEPEKTTTTDETFTVPANVKDLTEGDLIPVKFIISVGPKKPEIVVITWDITTQITHQEGDFTIEVPEATYEKNLFGVAGVRIEPPDQSGKMKVTGWLGICPVCAEDNEELIINQEKVEFLFTYPIPLPIGDSSATLTVEWKQK